jgi:hypothetical protein
MSSDRSWIEVKGRATTKPIIKGPGSSLRPSAVKRAKRAWDIVVHQPMLGYVENYPSLVTVEEDETGKENYILRSIHGEYTTNLSSPTITSVGNALTKEEYLDAIKNWELKNELNKETLKTFEDIIDEL